MKDVTRDNRNDLAASAPAILRGRTRTPRVLYISPHWPHRATMASEIRALNVARALREFGRVEMVVVDGEGRHHEWTAQSTREFEVRYGLPVESRRNRSWSQKLKWAVNPRQSYPHGCGVGEEDLRRVLRTAEEFDLVWHCKLRTPNMFPCWKWPRSVVDIDDVPSTFERAVLDSDSSKSRQLANWVRFLSWRQRDRRLGERFTVLGVCSEADRRYLRGLGIDAPVHVIPNGFDRPSTVPVRNVATPPRIGFVGIFDYWPNRSGIEWFVSRCWPRIKEQVPTARLRLVGRYSDGPLKPVGQDIDGLGWVSDIAEEISTWSAMVVPIHVGGGTRGKIALAFSQKCPVVSTTLGACGYESRDREIVYLADSAEAFSDACFRAIGEPAEAAAMAERAWRQFLEKWTWDAIRPSVLAAAEQCLQMSEAGAARHGADG